MIKAAAITFSSASDQILMLGSLLSDCTGFMALVIEVKLLF